MFVVEKQRLQVDINGDMQFNLFLKESNTVSKDEQNKREIIKGDSSRRKNLSFSQRPAEGKRASPIRLGRPKTRIKYYG